MLYQEASTLVEKNFVDGYYQLHNHIYTRGDTVASRNGTTKEILNFKTVLTNPINRCVGGWGRNVNIFFLMAESLWIFKGRRDLEFLDMFNGQMKNYSDDGKTFHSPYGWRMRKFGVESELEADSSNLHVIESARDQMLEALQMLYQNPEDRRVVISIWNTDFDLNKKYLDLPCNSMLMYKIRNGQLHQTIQNRSNDLDWGLSTNVFQFSFIGEVMSQILGIEYGTQVHNSQSLHLYMQLSDLTTYLESQFANGELEKNDFKFYDKFKSLPIEFKFREEGLSVAKKLFWIDFYLHAIILKLLNLHKEGETNHEDEALFKDELKTFSYALWVQYRLLKIYVDYKRHKSHELAITNLSNFGNATGIASYDIFVLSLNFFLRRVLDKDKEHYNDILKQVQQRFPVYKGIPIGKM
jgi:thymidylate synthase